MAPLVDKPKSASDANFIRIKFGENREAILNTSCRCRHLVESVKKACGCEDSDEIELVGSEGEFLGLSDPDKERNYANDYVHSRAVYYAVLVKIDPTKPTTQYVPLLKDLESVNPDLALKLHDLSNPNAKMLRQTWRAIGKKGAEVQRQREGAAAESQPLAGRRSGGTLKALLSKAPTGGEKKNSFIRLMAAASAAVAASPRAAA